MIRVINDIDKNRLQQVKLPARDSLKTLYSRNSLKLWQRSMGIDARKLWVAGVLVALYFLALTHWGIFTGFVGDDLTNISFLHGYGHKSLWVMLAEALSIFSPAYRPVGGLYYRSLLALAGFHPLPFRVVFFLFLILNIGLALIWFQQLTQSTLAAASGALFFAFHPTLANLYYSDGTIYDVLCAFFTLLALTQYVGIRKSHRFVTGNHLLLTVLLYGAALGSKEMAITLPAILVAYEATFHSNARDLRVRAWPILLLAGMTLVEMAVKVMLPNYMSTNPWYAPHYSLRYVGSAYLHYYRLLFLNDGIGAGALVALLAGALLLAVLMRRRAMVFGVLVANLALIPVCVIVPREGFVWYIPLLGYALYGGAAVSALTEKLSAHSRPRVPVRTSVFAALLIALYAFHYKRAARLPEPYRHEQDEIVALLAAAKMAAPELPRASRILIESDPHREIWWIPLFLMRLGYGDPTLWVDRLVNLGDTYNPDQAGLYDMRMRWDGAKYEVAIQPRSVASPVTFHVTPETADVFGGLRRGQTANIRLPKVYANCTIDAAYRLPDDEFTRAGVWFRWSELDESGSGVVRAGGDAERGVVLVDRIRACGRSWVPAEASFLIDP